MSQLLLPLVSFVFVASFTPGPNTLMLAASGANFGVRPSVPHILGILFGFPVLLLSIGLGFGQIFNALPQLHNVLRWAGTAFILYLAWKIATAGNLKNGKGASKPMSFLQAAVFQWLNPKAWVMGVSAVATYTTLGGNTFAESGLIALVFALFSVPACLSWCLFGSAIGRVLKSPLRLKIFNLVMAALLAGSVIVLYI